VPDNPHAEHSGVTFPLSYHLQMFIRDGIITYAYIDIPSLHALANIKANNNDLLTVTNYSHRPKCCRGMSLTIFTLNIFLYKLQMFTRKRIITNASIDIMWRPAVAHTKSTNNVILTVPNYSHGPKCDRVMCLTN